MSDNVEANLISGFRKAMIVQFTDIEKKMSSVFGTQSDNDIDSLVADISLFYDNFSDLTSGITKVLEQSCDIAQPVYTMFTGGVKYVASRIRRLQALLSDIRESMDEDPENIRLLQKTGGDIAKSIRFLFVPVQIPTDEGKALGSVTTKLEEFSDMFGGFYPVKPLWKLPLKKPMPVFDINDIAIVMQGPVIYDRDFTLETLYRYRYIYPQVTIVLSTWKGEVKSDFYWRAKSLDVIVVENEKPADTGKYNIRLQLTSTCKGIEQITEHSDIRYIMKTRTDQCFFLCDFLIYFKNLIRQYPAGDSRLSSRIIYLGWYNSRWSLPFYISDFFTFGAVDEIRKLYFPALNDLDLADHYNIHSREEADAIFSTIYPEIFEDPSAISEEERRTDIRKTEYIVPPESYIVRSYYETRILERRLSNEEDLLMHYWRYLIDSAVVVDAEMLGFYWYKYVHRLVRIGTDDADGALTHSMWLDMFLKDMKGDPLK